MQKTALEHDLQKLVEKALALCASGAKIIDVAKYQDWGLDTLEVPVWLP